MKKLNWTYIIIAVIIGLAIVGYGFLNYKAKTEVLEEKKTETSRELIETEERKRKLRNCINLAESRYKSRWNDSCERLNRDEECGLPSDLADSYDSSLQKEKDNCIDMFGD